MVIPESDANVIQQGSEVGGYNPGHTKCCTECEEGYEKWNKLIKWHYCAEACLNPDDIKILNTFDPGWSRNDNTNEPCFDIGYQFYNITESHGLTPWTHYRADYYHCHYH